MMMMMMMWEQCEDRQFVFLMVVLSVSRDEWVNDRRFCTVECKKLGGKATFGGAQRFKFPSTKSVCT